jgi:thermitase
MLWTIPSAGPPVTLSRLEGVVAVRPRAAPVARAERRRLVGQFGAAVLDDSEGGTFGLTVPARDRLPFERSGWLFVAPQPRVWRAAAAAGTVRGASAIRPVYLDPFGNLLVGTDLIVVQLPDELPEQAARERLEADGLKCVRRLEFAAGAFEVRLPRGVPADEGVGRLLSRDYRAVEPVFLEVIRGRLRPTDPDYPLQWQHQNIQSERAWDVTLGRGRRGPVRLAVIDHSFQVDHPDLAAGVVGGGYFADDGRGGARFVRFRPGRRFPPGLTGHGTFCLGMAGARINNKGVCGSAPEADLLPIACLEGEVGTQTTLARAIAYAADPRCEHPAAAAAGADVISCSLGVGSPGWRLARALDWAIRFAAGRGRGGLGIPIFWAVGNSGTPLGQDAVCSHPEVIAVGRSDEQDHAGGSAYGPRLEFVAPGDGVYSTQWKSHYGTATGTSYAAPLAAGVAALVLARHPRWPLRRLRRRLRESCDKVGGPGVTYDRHGHNPHYGFGRLNAASAVR